jgi:8-oxo-dGTP diphosphatase
MKSYVVGFIFNADRTKVALVEKTHPEWQKGRLNGVGGKIEDGETPLTAMVREAKEETGLVTQESDWDPVVTMERPEVEVVFFACKHLGDESAVYTTTDEKVAWYTVDELPRTVLSNLTWMIPLALDRFSDPSIQHVTVTHSENR